ncbi:MAG: hypothetical protein FGM39_10710 [Phycisphaerales bacterium]|nr:hypothetical protein [Phycisphaerales bacterium]
MTITHTAILGITLAVAAAAIGPSQDDLPLVRTRGAVSARPACGYREGPFNLLPRSRAFPADPWQARASAPELLPRIEAGLHPGPDGVRDAVAVEFDTKGVPAPDRWSCLELQAAATPGTTYAFSFSVLGPEGSFLAARGAAGAGYSRIPLNGRWQRVHLTEQATDPAPRLRIGLGVHRPDEPVPSQSLRVLLRGPQLIEGRGIVAYEPTDATMPPPWPLELVPPGALRRSCAPSDPGEGEAANLLRWSTKLDKAGWQTRGLAIDAGQAGPSPTGMRDAWMARESKGPGPHQVSGSVASTSGPCTASVYVKPQGRNAVMLCVASGDALAEARFDLTSDGTATSSTGGAGRIERVGQGWYRVALTMDAAADGEATFSIALLDAPAGQADYAGDGTSGLLIWGPQLETGPRATSYIPTFFVPETREADEPIRGPSPE